MEAKTPPMYATNGDILEAPIMANIQEKSAESFKSPVPIEKTRKSIEVTEEGDENSTIHDFNRSNVTVIDKAEADKLKSKLSLEIDSSKQLVIGNGSDSGMEVCGIGDNILHQAFSSNSDCTPAQSCDSSLSSCCSTYEDAYDTFSRRNSTLIEDIKRNGGEGASERGSESSSRPLKRLATAGKKKVNVTDVETEKNILTKARSRLLATKVTATSSKQTGQTRSKSKDRLQKPPVTLQPSSSPSLPATSSTRSKSPVTTPYLTLPRSHCATSIASDSSTTKSRVMPKPRKEKSADSILGLYNKPPSRASNLRKLARERPETTPKESQLKAMTKKLNKLTSELKEEKETKVGFEQKLAEQENEISKLYSSCRQLKKNLEKSLTAQNCLLQQQQDFEVEGKELKDFMQAEKSILTEALTEMEHEIKTYQKSIKDCDHEIERYKVECKISSRVHEQICQESLQARIGALDLLLQQGAAVSRTALAFMLDC